MIDETKKEKFLSLLKKLAIHFKIDPEGEKKGFETLYNILKTKMSFDEFCLVLKDLALTYNAHKRVFPFPYDFMKALERVREAKREEEREEDSAEEKSPVSYPDPFVCLKNGHMVLLSEVENYSDIIQTRLKTDDYNEILNGWKLKYTKFHLQREKIYSQQDLDNWKRNLLTVNRDKIPA